LRSDGQPCCVILSSQTTGSPGNSSPALPRSFHAAARRAHRSEMTVRALFDLVISGGRSIVRSLALTILSCQPDELPAPHSGREGEPCRAAQEVPAPWLSDWNAASAFEALSSPSFIVRSSSCRAVRGSARAGCPRSFRIGSGRFAIGTAAACPRSTASASSARKADQSRSTVPSFLPAWPCGPRVPSRSRRASPWTSCSSNSGSHAFRNPGPGTARPARGACALSGCHRPCGGRAPSGRRLSSR
jgi:hypothetical protein